MTASRKPVEVRRTARPDAWLTKEQAAEHDLVPLGHAWDERQQRAVPRGELIRSDSLERPLDLEANLAAMDRNRKTLERFVDQMEEAEYDAKRVPIPGKMHDFYRMPDFDRKALTKQGGTRLAQLHGYRRGATRSVARECRQDFAMALVRVQLVDRWGFPVGSGEAACSTAEAGFHERTAMKYGGDCRAAFNEVVATAGKRAFIQGLVYATATDDLFDVSGQVEKTAEAKGASEEAPTARFPAKIRAKPFRDLAGKLLSDRSISVKRLAEARQWCIDRGEPQAVQPLIAAIDAELSARRAGDDRPL
ncbi:MAG TPA: hypothetical protein VNG95_01980 [Gemmatimonadales bacterium]|nr:hypothetical protein [Gemmatimonadales bacterium]